ncbi:MAG: uroporphyrinogen-III synthase [Lysobacterales bacterium]
MNTEDINNRTLSGLSVLIGRPAGWAHRWRAAFETEGAVVIHQPALTISSVTPPASTLEALEGFGRSHSAVFSSRPAVEHGLSLPGVKNHLQQGTCWAVGRQTARELMAAGMGSVRIPSDGYGADALLHDPEFPSADKVWLFGAQGGRTVIARTLAERGIDVRNVWVYQRSPAPLDVDAQNQLAAVKAGSLLVIASSIAVLERLHELHGSALDHQHLVSLGHRISLAAEKYRFATIVTAQSPDLPSILAAAKLASQHR